MARPSNRLLRSIASLTFHQACVSHAATTFQIAPATKSAACLGIQRDHAWLRWGPTPRQMHHQMPGGAEQRKRVDAESPWNTPNMLSVARGASGPFIACLIVNEQWAPACAAVVVSGATDWLDGYLARRMGLNSVLGSYLDPLGDKLLICSVALALAFKGLIPTWVVVVVVGRDVALVAGTVFYRWRSLGWRTMPMRDFLNTRAPADNSDGTAVRVAGVVGEEKQDGGHAEVARHADQPHHASGATHEGTPGMSDRPRVDVGVPVMRPLMISKVNTVLQLTLIAGYLSKAWVAWPEPDSLYALELATAATTGASCVAYAHKFVSGGGSLSAKP